MGERALVSVAPAPGVIGEVNLGGFGHGQAVRQSWVLELLGETSSPSALAELNTAPSKEDGSPVV